MKVVADQDPSLVALRTLCRDGAGRAHEPVLRDGLLRILARLDRPMQLAVAGATSAGKSTLINAVLRRHVAHVDAGHCTSIVTWFEHGPDDGRVQVELLSGRTVERRLVGGMVPTDLGAPAEDVARIRVQLSDSYLRTVTVIDTPGLNSVLPTEQATRGLLFGDAAAEHAQALLYVMKHVQNFDAATLEEFTALSAACGMSAVDAVVVLNKIDQHGPAADPWPDAVKLTARAEEQLRGRVLDVVPAVGLLAEAARARRLGAAEHAALRRLAALPAADLDEELFDEGVDMFALGVPAANISADTAGNLVAILHRFGVLAATAYLREHPEADLEALLRHLAGRSGFGLEPPLPARAGRPTPAHVLERFARNADQLKAFAAVGDIRRLGRAPAGERDAALVRELRAAVDEHRPIVSGLAGLRILQACAALSRGQLLLDEEMTEELLTMARGSSPAERLGLPPGAPPDQVADAARQASIRWRRVAVLAGPTVGGHRAHDVLRALEDVVAAHTDTSRGQPRGPTKPEAPRPRTTTPDLLAEDDRPLVKRLVAGPTLGAGDREIVQRLLDAATARSAVGVPDNAAASDVRAAALAVVGRLRVLLHRPLAGPDRRALHTVCSAFEGIALSAPSEGTYQ